MDFMTKVEYARERILSYMDALKSGMFEKTIKMTMTGWRVENVVATDVFSICSPYNGQKGTPNIIHPPDTRQIILYPR